MPRHSFWKSVFSERQRTVRDAGRGKPKGGERTVTDKRKAPGSAATLTGAERGKSGETSSTFDSTSAAAGRQGKIFSMLLQGEEHAIPGQELARMAGVSPRKLRLMVDQERLKYPICASDSGYFLHDNGNKGILELRKFLRRQDRRCAANRRVTRSARMTLRALERAPIPGQTDLWQGGDT